MYSTAPAEDLIEYKLDANNSKEAVIWKATLSRRYLSGHTSNSEF